MRPAPRAISFAVVSFAAVSFAVFAVVTTACAPSHDDVKLQINEHIQGLSFLPFEEPSRVEGEPTEPVRDGDYSCHTRDVAETRAFDEVVAYAANSGSLWPGAIIRGDSVYTGLFTPLVYDRQPLTLSVSLENLGGAKSGTMEAPSLSSFRETVSGILSAEVTGATPANIYAEIESVHTEEQLALALGAQSSWPGAFADISASFNFAQDDKRSRHVVRFVQAYYTVDVDPPKAPADFFADTVTLEDIQADMYEGNPPVYVSSITYGRLVVFTFESVYSSEEMGAALEFAYRGGADVSGDVSLTYREMLSSSKITAYILGGSGGEAARAIESYEDLVAFIQSGGDYSRESPGAPIAYKLSYLRDNSPARLSFTQDYEVEECVRVTQQVRVTLKGIRVDNAGGDNNDDLEIYGLVTAEADDVVELFNKDSANNVAVAAGTTWPQSGTAAEALLHVTPQAGNAITLRADLSDSDGVDFDDVICSEVVSAPFESGWRRDVDVLCTGAGAQLTVMLRLDPI